jgi:hypothetical protein
MSHGPPFEIFCPVLALTKVGSAGSDSHSSRECLEMRKDPLNLECGEIKIKLYIFYGECAKTYINDIQIDKKQFNYFQTTYSAHDIDPKLFKEEKM